MGESVEYRGYKIRPYSRSMGLPSGGFQPYGSIAISGDTKAWGLDGKTYPTKEEAEEVFIDSAKGYIDNILE